MTQVNLETEDPNPDAPAAAPPRATAAALHDAVSQSLVALTLQARAASRTLELGDPEAIGRAQAALADITHLSHTALAQMGALRVELGADGIAVEGLVAALRRHAASLAARDGLTVEVDGPDGRLPLDAATESALYRRGQVAVASLTGKVEGAISIVVAERGGRVLMDVGGDGVEPIRTVVGPAAAGDQPAHQ